MKLIEGGASMGRPRGGTFPAIPREELRMTIQLEFWPTLTFAVVMLCWLVFAGAFIFRKKPPKTTESKRESASIAGIALQAVGYALVWSIRRTPFTPLVSMNKYAEIALALLTMALALASVWMVMAAVKRLGKEWSFAARLVEGHRLVTEGPYSLVRNPIYTGMLGMLVATGLAITHWIALPFALIIFLIGTVVRVRSEEKLLREAFGTEFEEYARRVPALIPGVY